MVVRIGVAGMAAALALTACGANADTAEPDAGVAADAGASASAGDVAELLSLQAATVDGGELDLETLAGRDVAMWFWAPW